MCGVQIDGSPWPFREPDLILSWNRAERGGPTHVTYTRKPGVREVGMGLAVPKLPWDYGKLLSAKGMERDSTVL